MKNYLGIVPARGGSKEIPRKNIVEVCGHPLIRYTIDPALKLKQKGILKELIVSTDCSEIAELSKSYGCNVPFLRPLSISGDKSKSIDFMEHALNYYEERSVLFDAVVLLQPTSPLRTYDDIYNAIKLFDERENDSLISCYEEEYINEYVMYNEINNGNLRPVNSLHNKGGRRQDHEKFFVRNGAIYITTVSYLNSNRSIICDTPILYKMNKCESFNVDTYEDLKIIEKLL